MKVSVKILDPSHLNHDVIPFHTLMIPSFSQFHAFIAVFDILVQSHERKVLMDVKMVVAFSFIAFQIADQKADTDVHIAFHFADTPSRNPENQSPTACHSVWNCTIKGPRIAVKMLISQPKKSTTRVFIASQILPQSPESTAPNNEMASLIRLSPSFTPSMIAQKVASKITFIPSQLFWKNVTNASITGLFSLEKL